MGLTSNKNFIHTNAVENIMSVAKKPTPKYVDKPSGTTNNLEVRKQHTKTIYIPLIFLVSLSSILSLPLNNCTIVAFPNNSCSQDSGLVPRYIKKDNYGTVPKYLEKRKQAMTEQQQAYDDYIQQRFERGALNQITPDER